MELVQHYIHKDVPPVVLSPSKGTFTYRDTVVEFDLLFLEMSQENRSPLIRSSYGQAISSYEQISTTIHLKLETSREILDLLYPVSKMLTRPPLSLKAMGFDATCRIIEMDGNDREITLILHVNEIIFNADKTQNHMNMI